jgi:hypothetical protein
MPDSGIGDISRGFWNGRKSMGILKATFYHCRATYLSEVAAVQIPGMRTFPAVASTRPSANPPHMKRNGLLQLLRNQNLTFAGDGKVAVKPNHAL